MDGLAVEGDREAVILGFQTERMPLTGRDLDVRARELLAAAFHYSVEADIIFQRICACDVIIIRRSKAHRDAAGLIFPASNRLKADRDLNILSGNWLVYGERKAVVRPIRAGLFDRALARGGHVVDDHPFTRRALARACKFKFSGRGA